MITRDFDVPIDQRYFEDYTVGSAYEYGAVSRRRSRSSSPLRGSSIRKPIHVDPEAAANGPFGGLIASGWHTSALMMRLFVDHYLSSVASLASPGVDELRWMKPVRPGRHAAHPGYGHRSQTSRSKPDRGIVRTLIEVLNQRGEIVSSMNAMNLLRCRTPAWSPSPPCRRTSCTAQPRCRTREKAFGR